MDRIIEFVIYVFGSVFVILSFERSSCCIRIVYIHTSRLELEEVGVAIRKWP